MTLAHYHIVSLYLRSVHNYFIKTPWWLKQLYRSYTWSMPAADKEVYLTFDDGPHPEITPWVLEQLKLYDAKATFFCIGNNVKKYPGIYNSIIAEGHAVGNHTYNHLNGWNTETSKYIDDADAASQLINSKLFRPPYGRIKRSQGQYLMQQRSMKIIMWDVLSADWDQNISGEECATNVLNNSGAGSVIVFHDSEKAKRNLVYALPLVLKTLKESGFLFRKIDESKLC